MRVCVCCRRPIYFGTYHHSTVLPLSVTAAVGRRSKPGLGHTGGSQSTQEFPCSSYWVTYRQVDAPTGVGGHTGGSQSTQTGVFPCSSYFVLRFHLPAVGEAGGSTVVVVVVKASTPTTERKKRVGFFRAFALFYILFLSLLLLLLAFGPSSQRVCMSCASSFD